MTTNLFAGLISGTSMDGIDAVLADLENPRQPRIVRFQTTRYSDDLAADLAQVAAGKAVSAGQFAALDARIGEAFAAAAANVIGDESAVRGIGCHGQNVYHGPQDRPPATWQLGNPHLVAQRTGCAVVADFRRRDLALGGQGAPLAPLLHEQLLRHDGEHRAVLNVGGIANLSLLPAEPDQPVTGFDTGPGNCLMDEWIQRLRHEPYDRDGTWAASGRVSRPMLECLIQDPYFERAAPKSTGREYFNLDWLERQCDDLELDAASVQATLAELTAVTVGNALEAAAPDTSRLLVCGGGVHNSHLMDRLARRLPRLTVTSTQDLGLPPDAVEALLFAELARRAILGQASDLSAVTGAPAHCYGVVFPA